MDKKSHCKQGKSEMKSEKPIKSNGTHSECSSDGEEMSTSDQERTNSNNKLKKRRAQAAQEL